MRTYIACFDISDDDARRQVSKRLEQVGTRVQRSVFEISLKTLDELTRLRGELLALLEPFDDVRFYPLCRDCRSKSHNAKGERVAAFPAAAVV